MRKATELRLQSQRRSGLQVFLLLPSLSLPMLTCWALPWTLIGCSSFIVEYTLGAVKLSQMKDVELLASQDRFLFDRQQDTRQERFVYILINRDGTNGLAKKNKHRHKLH